MIIILYKMKLLLIAQQISAVRVAKTLYQSVPRASLRLKLMKRQRQRKIIKSNKRKKLAKKME